MASYSMLSLTIPWMPCNPAPKSETEGRPRGIPATYPRHARGIPAACPRHTHSEAGEPMGLMVAFGLTCMVSSLFLAIPSIPWCCMACHSTLFLRFLAMPSYSMLFHGMLFDTCPHYFKLFHGILWHASACFSL